MKIQEADAKSLLLAQGLPVPGWEVARSAPAARQAAERAFAAGAGQVVVKAQVLVGGRGKAGGVKLAADADEAEAAARTILGLEIKGIPVRKLLVGPAADIVQRVLPRVRSSIASAGGSCSWARPRAASRSSRSPQANPAAIAPGRTPIPTSACSTGRPASWPSRSASAGPPARRLRGDRQGPGADDGRQRRRPRRDQPAGDRARGGRRRQRRSSAWPASTPRSPSTTRPSSATRASRRCATSTRRIRSIARRASDGISFIKLDGDDRLHGQRRRPGDDDDGPRQAGRRRAGQLPRHRRRRQGGQGDRGDAPHPRRPAR